MKLYFPSYATKVLNTLLLNGCEAYFVGGCVRDMLLCKSPTDFDITTNASTSDVKRLFSKTIDTGIKHGTVTVISENRPVEVTTYRIDGKYENHRKPMDVIFSKNLKEDILRRDFTINAICYNEKDGIIDLCNGMEDIKLKLIKAVGDPTLRFNEDALRILRALRFSCTLDFSIESSTYNAIVSCSSLLSHISGERIWSEICKILMCGNPEKILFLANCGVADVIDTAFSCAIRQNSKLLFGSCADLSVRLAVLFFGFDFIPFFEKMKTDKKTITEVMVISETVKKGFFPDKISIKKLLSQISEDLVFKSIFAYKSLYNKNEEPFLKVLSDIKEKDECVRISQLKVSGNDLLSVGLSGKEIGEALLKLLDHVINHPEENDREILIKLIKKR